MPDIIKLNELDDFNARFAIQLLPDGSWIRGGAPKPGALLYQVRAESLESAVQQVNVHAAAALEAKRLEREAMKERRVVDDVELINSMLEIKRSAHVHFGIRNTMNPREGDRDSAVLEIELCNGASIKIEFTPEQYMRLMSNHYFTVETSIRRPGVIELDKLPTFIDGFEIEREDLSTTETRELAKSLLLDDDIADKCVALAKQHNMSRVAVLNSVDGAGSISVVIHKT
jgi:hypothetical protein